LPGSGLFGQSLFGKPSRDPSPHLMRPPLDLGEVELLPLFLGAEDLA
jgi:hypothetical protein